MSTFEACTVIAVYGGIFYFTWPVWKMMARDIVHSWREGRSAQRPDRQDNPFTEKEYSEAWLATQVALGNAKRIGDKPRQGIDFSHWPRRHGKTGFQNSLFELQPDSLARVHLRSVEFRTECGYCGFRWQGWADCPQCERSGITMKDRQQRLQSEVDAMLDAGFLLDLEYRPVLGDMDPDAVNRNA